MRLFSLKLVTWSEHHARKLVKMHLKCPFTKTPSSGITALCVFHHATSAMKWVQACSTLMTASSRPVLCDFSDQLIAFFVFLSLSQNRLSVNGICGLLKSVNTCQKMVEVQVRYVGLESFLRLIPVDESES